jgi:hypothetical protein
MPDRRNPGEQLNHGQSITSPDGRYRLTMQDDGNLVLYRQTDGEPLWQSNTLGQPATHAIMQADGNLVIKASDGRPLWSSHTSNHPGACLFIQNDGNVVIYEQQQAIWATGTCEQPDPPKRSRWPIWVLAVLGAVVGAVVVASETVTSIHADRGQQSPYQFTVAVFGLQVHQSAIPTTEELLPRMRVWAYGLMAGFAASGALLGSVIGWAVYRRTKRCT